MRKPIEVQSLDITLATGSDPQRMQSRDGARLALGIPPTAFVAICTAPDESVLDAWREVCSFFPYAILLVASPAHERMPFGPQTVRWIGERDDVRTLFAASDIHVHSAEGSRDELLDALRAGVPTIAAENATSRALLLDGRSGLLIAPRNSRALASSILLLASAPAVRAELARGALNTALL